MQRTVTTTTSDGSEAQEVRTVPIIGFIDQLGGVHTVALKSAPQSSSFTSSGSTLVIRLLTTSKWAPPEVWENLKKGRHHVLRS